MRRLLFFVLAVLVLAPVLIFAFAAFFEAQRADYGYMPHVPRPLFTTTHPRVVFDEAHGNATTGGFTGRGFGFTRLLRADGLVVEQGRARFTGETLRGVDLLVIENASGSNRPQAFGINLDPNGGGEARARPAFTGEEIAAVLAWVDSGGALLLVADHAPFGAAARGLATAFGVTMHGGFVEVPGESSDPLMFSRANGRLGAHPINSGVRRVQTFTGQSLDGPTGSTVLLRLPKGAVESDPDAEERQPAGEAQGVAFGFGRGRVVVLGEAAMINAQVSRRKRFGMNLSDNDNERFALNAVSWLLRRGS